MTYSSDTDNQESLNIKFEESSERTNSEIESSPDNEINESDTAYADTSNINSSTSNQDSITMITSDLITDTDNQQSSNLTAVDHNSKITLEEKLAKGITPDIKIDTPLPTYKVKVQFDSITVYEDHEGPLSGDAEYDLTVYVQGVKVELTDKTTGERIWMGQDIPPFGLGDVSEGETVTFDPDTEVTVEIPETLPLLIFTVGDEVDHSCRSKHPENILDKLITILHKPKDTWFDSIKVIQHNENFNTCTTRFNNSELINPSDILGIITKFYDPPSYGGGPHTNVVSDTGDFILRYTITVIPPQ
ncbi:MAG TPA: hypothetical protein VFK40_09780 [Nitrososphaeraceae archaeon]|nr:hypothetical protein [Nitrososphaeraceae archaeon]